MLNTNNDLDHQLAELNDKYTSVTTGNPVPELEESLTEVQLLITTQGAENAEKLQPLRNHIKNLIELQDSHSRVAADIKEESEKN